MLLIGLAAVVLFALAPQAEPDIEALLAPAMTPNDVAAFCFAPANRQPGERDRECQYRVLREDPVRVARIDGLRHRCRRDAGSPGEATDDCVTRIILAERAAAEAARLERIAALEKARTDDPFGGFLDLDTAPAAATPPPPEPSAPPRRNCRRETTVHPDGTGGSVTWTCGNDEALADQVRDMLRPR